ncbi:hypothetical protein A0J61_05048 [Choanephora cucurbitarum]|uniref:Helitron helicase-like domain-containing protein n=1 Tax=Choanephora cucurbitarum TaxID=101091 RepID=A0A1C7NCR1_9FUNG|nr:hypothetical protein A0J61_05048 [Choanephora cucurbitarum]
MSNVCCTACNEPGYLRCTFRVHAIAGIHIATLQQLQQLMHRLNPFVSIFKNMMHIANGQPNEIESLENIKLVFRAEGVPNRRRYHRPAHGFEVAAIIVGGENDNDILNSRDIVVRYQDDSLIRVKELNQCHYTMSFCFPLGQT